MSDYKNYGQAGAMGDNARSDNNQFTQVAPAGSVDLAALASQLALVRAEMKRRADPAQNDHDEAIGTIASAEKAAKAGDQSKALGFLKSAGTWALEVSKSIAAELVKDGIEGKFGA